jgi:hypothetical protein
LTSPTLWTADLLCFQRTPRNSQEREILLLAQSLDRLTQKNITQDLGGDPDHEQRRMFTDINWQYMKHSLNHCKNMNSKSIKEHHPWFRRLRTTLLHELMHHSKDHSINFIKLIPFPMPTWPTISCQSKSILKWKLVKI